MSTACVPGSPTSRWATPRTCPSAAAASCPCSWPATTTAAAAVDTLLSTHSPAEYNGSWLLVGDRASLFFVDFTGTAGGTAVSLPPGIHVLENRALDEPSPKVDLVRAALGAPADADEVADGVPPRPGRPHEPRGRGAAERGQLRASGGIRDAVVVPRASCHGNRDAALWVADGPPCTTPYGGRQGLWADARPANRGRAACSAGGGAGRRRRRGACAGRPRSR